VATPTTVEWHRWRQCFQKTTKVKASTANSFSPHVQISGTHTRGCGCNLRTTMLSLIFTGPYWRLARVCGSQSQARSTAHSSSSESSREARSTAHWNSSESSRRRIRSLLKQSRSWNQRQCLYPQHQNPCSHQFLRHLPFGTLQPWSSQGEQGKLVVQVQVVARLADRGLEALQDKGGGRRPLHLLLCQMCGTSCWRESVGALREFVALLLLWRESGPALPCL